MDARGFIDWLTGSSRIDEVACAQYRELRRQLPLLYALLAINGLSVAFSHHGHAPAMLTIWCPALLVLLCLGRLAFWLSRRGEDMPVAMVHRRLRRTIILSGMIALAFVLWSLALENYGGEMHRAHVAFFISITVIGCIFCLMNLPGAALLVTAIVMLPTLAYYLVSGNPIFIAMAINIALVTVVMIRVLLNNHKSFVSMIDAQTGLAQVHRQAVQLSEENSRLANTDSLTGLPNRRHFFARLEALIAQGAAEKSGFALGLVDLDKFKPVNDTYGHVVGDELLVAVAARMREAAGRDVAVARLGGDEFAFVVAQGQKGALATGTRICAALAEPFHIGDLTLGLGSSCGIALYPEAGRTAQDMMDKADFALYGMKAGGRGGVRLFTHADESQLRSERIIERVLLSARYADELHIHFQPVIDMEGRHVEYVEALARWTSPTLGVVRPAQFIAVAERMGLIHQLTLQLLEQVLDNARLLPPHLGVAFNLAPQNITSPETVADIARLIREGPIAPGRISFELTESAVVQDFDSSVHAMTVLREMGAKIALDDFGTGLSSLSHLQRLPIDRVTVDRSLTKMDGRASPRNLLGAISTLCRDMDLACVVEGVESHAQLAHLRALGYRYAQGYLFARPMPLPGLLAWMSSGELAGLVPVEAPLERRIIPPAA